MAGRTTSDPAWRAGGPAVVAPSILSADFAHLGRDVERVVSAGARVLHLDVMDGHFVPNITFGPPLVASVRGVTDCFLDCHLMIEEPLRYAGAFVDAGAGLVSIHAELFQDPRAALSEIRSRGVRCGIVLNPDTPVERVRGSLGACDLVLVMAVFPGFGGQLFRPEALGKIEALRALRAQAGLSYVIEVDGGVSPSNARQLVEAGADVLVAGSAVFGLDDPGRALVAIEAAARGAG